MSAPVLAFDAPRDTPPGKRQERLHEAISNAYGRLIAALRGVGIAAETGRTAVGKALDAYLIAEISKQLYWERRSWRFERALRFALASDGLSQALRSTLKGLVSGATKITRIPHTLSIAEREMVEQYRGLDEQERAAIRCIVTHLARVGGAR